MSRVLTFSRTFPSYHPRKGEPTYFVEKIWNNILKNENTSYYEICSLNDNIEENKKAIIWDFWVMLKKAHEVPESKYHTIRAGHRWKVGYTAVNNPYYL